MTVSIFPQINLNGTDGNVLMKEYADAYYAVNEACTKLLAATCHGRDYQGHPINNAFMTAQREQGERIGKLESVRADIAAILAEMQRQMRERAR